MRTGRKPDLCADLWRATGCAALLALAVMAWLPARGASEVPAVRLDPVLERLASIHESHGPDAARARAVARGMVLRPGDRLAVVLEPWPGRGAESIDRERVRALGGEIDARSRSWARALVPVAHLRALATHPDVRRVRAPIRTLPFGVGRGDSVSEAVTLTGADALQKGGFDGAGIRVAVIDVGFADLSSGIAEGDVPADTVTVDFTGTGIATGSSHGVGVAEQLMDMAPGAELHCLKVETLVDLENAADYLLTHGIRVANHSVGWVNASYYDDTGPVNDVVNRSRDEAGVLWTLAAGNLARKHWRGTWTDADGNGWLEFAPTEERNAFTTQSSQPCVYLNWDQYGNPRTDLDLFVYDVAGDVVASGQSLQVASVDPAEEACFTYDAASAPYEIGVRRRSGPTSGIDLTLFSFRNDLAIRVAASSFLDPADAHGAFSIGAIHRLNWDLPDPPIEVFSSQGPTNDGRPKPDLVAPDRTTSLTNGPWGAVGTSFSAGTVAGAAALLLSLDPGLTVGEVETLLAGTAEDVGDPGADPVFGAGKLDLGAAAAAILDDDEDGVFDGIDNCPFFPNPRQEDAGGIDPAGPDAIGDACQCGDVTGDGRVRLDDATLIKRDILGLGPAIPFPEKCNVIGDPGGEPSRCQINDATVVKRALLGLGPGVEQICGPALPQP